MSGETPTVGYSVIPQAYRRLFQASGVQPGQISSTDQEDVVEIRGERVNFEGGLTTEEMETAGINSQLAAIIDAQGEEDGVLQANEVETFGQQHVARFAEAFGITEEQAWTLYGQSAGEDAFSTLSSERLETIEQNRAAACRQITGRLADLPTGEEASAQQVASYVYDQLHISEDNPIRENIQAYVESREPEVPSAQDIANLIDRVYVASFLSSGGANAHEVLDVPGPRLPGYTGDFSADSLGAALRGESTEEASEAEEVDTEVRDQLLARGVEEFNEENFSEAVSIFEQAQREYGLITDPRVLTVWADSYHRADNSDRAVEILRRIPRDISNPVLNSLRETYGAQLGPDMDFGAEETSDEPEEGEEITATTTEATPTGPRIEAQRLFSLGVESYRQGNYQQAIEHFEASYRVVQHPRMQISIARCQEMLERYEEATETLNGITVRDLRFEIDRQEVAWLRQRLEAREVALRQGSQGYDILAAIDTAARSSGENRASAHRELQELVEQTSSTEEDDDIFSDGFSLVDLPAR
jgi:tetratricopeptide (TPR) repeat protein